MGLFRGPHGEAFGSVATNPPAYNKTLPTTARENGSLDKLRNGLLISLADVPAWHERLIGRRISHQGVWAWTRYGVTVGGGREYLRAFKRNRR
jgi:hypothetical protein